MEIALILMGIFAIVALLAVSLYIRYLWDKWIAKEGAKEALKETGINAKLNNIENKLDINNLSDNPIDPTFHPKKNNNNKEEPYFKENQNQAKKK